MTHEMPMTSEPRTARHARLFELIRQSNLAAMQSQKAARPPRPTATRRFAHEARKSLTPQEQQVLGISESFGR
ncbi:hypothetical protein RXV86_20045 [Alisedimentitalea sp. MJ-SS2]|uniref:hypothetical protein n=1 Tax=Aliisedimentitalea sp. MJ-SS2 TaxID=3049795 RepID=UPI00290C2EA2|nr:hypothetical protein [Alisedimentitalea sp. MJ-SS2]MDU8929683.1 hypothetical protein [Alisedimentitalea sp. MJ-SS2]